MRYLTGAFRKSQTDTLIAAGVGVMLQPGSGYASAVESAGFPCWAADNGCYAKGDKFDLGDFYRWLDRVPTSRLLFAVAPDVVGDPASTLRRSLPVLAELRARGMPPAFVAQDGLTEHETPWTEFSWLFIGGQTAWKFSEASRRLIRASKRNGKRVHFGRVNSERRLRYATLIGCDSADGTFLKFANRGGSDGTEKLAKWFRQPILHGL